MLSSSFLRALLRPADNDGVAGNDRFKDFLELMRVQVTDFKRPVMYVHGDDHHFMYDMPLQDSKGYRLMHFNRLQTFGDNDDYGNNKVRVYILHHFANQPIQRTRFKFGVLSDDQSLRSHKWAPDSPLLLVQEQHMPQDMCSSPLEPGNSALMSAVAIILIIRWHEAAQLEALHHMHHLPLAGWRPTCI
jgi:hypothetical protein